MGTMPRRCRRVWSAGVIAAAIAAVAPASATAADFTVTTFADPPPGACAPADCSLREAVIAANAAAGPDRIVLGAGSYSLTIAGAGDDAAGTGDLDVTLDRVSVVGAGPGATTITAQGLSDRVFDVLAGGQLVVGGATVRGGQVTGEGGGVRTAGTLIVRDAAIRENRSSGAGSGVFAAAGHVDISDSVIDANTSGGDAALHAEGGTTTTLTRVDVTGNKPTGSGTGGIENSGTMTLTEVNVSGNTAGTNSGGGGIRNQSGALAITRSTISGNRAPTSDSGALFAPAGVVTMRSVTISGNEAASNGGAVRTQGTALVHLDAVTIAGNTSPGASVIAFGDSRIYVRGSVIGDNSATQCQGDGIVSLGGNVAEGGTCATLTGAGDILGPDPRLGPLAGNGGRTLTHALLAGSPALDAAGAGCASVDQRGIARPLGAACDAGAVEARPDLQASFTGGPADFAPGTPAQLTVRVTNAGTGGAGGAGLTLRAAGLELLSATPSQGTCATAGTCALGLIPPGGEATVTVTARAAAPGAASLSANATTMADRQPGDNAASAAVAVIAPPPPVTPAPVTPAPAARPAVLALPRLTGSPRVGRKLRCVGARFSGARSRSITWLRGSRRIARQTRVAYRLRRADRGKVVACAVRAKGPGGAVRVVSLGVFVRR